MDRLRDLYFLLKDVARLTARNFERQAAEEQFGLTLVECRVLVYLQRNEGISQVRLAYLTDTDPMTLVRILDRMENDGWLERRLDPSDRRARRLYVKPAAQPVLKRVWRIADRSRNEALSGLDVAEGTQLLDLLERMHDNLSALLPGGAGELRQAGATTGTVAVAGTPAKLTLVRRGAKRRPGSPTR